MGLLRTIDAYSYVIGILQPVLAFLLFTLSYQFPAHYEFETIQHSLGPSGSVSTILTGHGATRGFNDAGFVIYKVIGSLLISVYLCPALSVAHGLRLRWGVAAILTAALFFLCVDVTCFAIISEPWSFPTGKLAAGWVSYFAGLLSYFFLITDYPQPSKLSTNHEHSIVSAGFERWHGTKSSFKEASVRLSLPLVTERRISAGRR